ncbi:MAG: hypothetical protein B7Z22_13990, partial [Hyphomonas sp. 32-62-5]
ITEPEQQLEFVDQFIADPEISCGLRGNAMLRKYLLLDRLGRTEDAIETLFLLLDEDMFREPAMRNLRGRLLVNLAVLDRSEDQTNRWIEVLKKEMALMPEYSALYRSILAQELALSGERDMAIPMALEAMRPGPEHFSIDAINDKKRFQRRDEDRRAVAIGFDTLMEMGELDAALGAMKAVAATSDVPDFWLLWAFYSCTREGVAPEVAIEAAETLEQALGPDDEAGYLGPKSMALSFALLSLAHRNAGHPDLAEKYLKAGKKRFGKSFDAEQVLADETDRIARTRENKDDVVEATLATPVQPKWPWEDGFNSETRCLTRLNVDEKGKPFNVTAECENKLFEKSAVNALKRVRFNP